MVPNNNQSNKGGIGLYITNNIPVMVKPEQTFTRNGIETIIADQNTPILSGIIIVGLVYKWSVDIGTENFSLALEYVIFSLNTKH